MYIAFVCLSETYVNNNFYNLEKRLNVYKIYRCENIKKPSEFEDFLKRVWIYKILLRTINQKNFMFRLRFYSLGGISGKLTSLTM